MPKRAQKRGGKDKKGGKGKGSLYNPSEPLTGKALKRASKRASAAEFGPQKGQLKRATRTVREQGNELQKRVRDYYGQLGQSEGNTIQRQEALSQALNARLAAIAQGAQGAIAQSQARGEAAIAEDEALRGRGLGGGAQAQLAQEQAARAAAAAAAGQTYQTYGARQGAGYAQESNAARQARQVGGREAASRLAIQQANQLFELEEKKQELARARNQARTKLALELRQQEAQNQLAAEGLNLDAKKSKQQKKLTKRGQNVTKRGQDITAEQRAKDRAERRAAREDKAEEEKGLTDDERDDLKKAERFLKTTLKGQTRKNAGLVLYSKPPYSSMDDKVLQRALEGVYGKGKSAKKKGGSSGWGGGWGGWNS